MTDSHASELRSAVCGVTISAALAPPKQRGAAVDRGPERAPAAGGGAWGFQSLSGVFL